MSCCGGAKPNDRTDLAMCLHCGGGHTNMTTCGVDGAPIAEHVFPTMEGRRLACPKHRHTDAAGCVRWCRIRWVGVPRPVRAKLAWWGIRPRPALPECGCVAVLAGAFEATTRIRLHGGREPARTNIPAH